MPRDTRRLSVHTKQSYTTVTGTSGATTGLKERLALASVNQAENTHHESADQRFLHVAVRPWAHKPKPNKLIEEWPTKGTLLLHDKTLKPYLAHAKPSTGQEVGLGMGTAEVTALGTSPGALFQS